MLRGMIADRDARMEKIQRKSQEQAQRNVELCQQLETVTAEERQQSKQISNETHQLVSQYQAVLHKLEQMQRDFKQQGASLKTYSKDASILGKVGANGGSGDASYVMRMQAQLCKAMHSLGITDHQMELATKHTELIVKYQKETLIQCREERTSTELNLMNQLIEKDNERRTIEESYQAKLDVIFKEREALERQMEESGHDLEDDDDDNEGNADDTEEDPEEKEMKQELMQLLTERRAEIERLEVAMEEQEELMAELEEQVADAVQSPPGVTQRKSQALTVDTTTTTSSSSSTTTTTVPPTEPTTTTTSDNVMNNNEPNDKVEDDTGDDDDDEDDPVTQIEEPPPPPQSAELEVPEVDDDTNPTTDDINVGHDSDILDHDKIDDSIETKQEEGEVNDDPIPEETSPTAAAT